MITYNTREDDQATITPPTNAPIVQNMPLTNPVVIQQEQVHIQTQIQEYEQNDATSTRVIGETTLRIYFPRVPDAYSTIPITSASSPGHFTTNTLVFQDKATDTQGLPLLLFAHSPLLPTMSTRFYLAKFCYIC